MKVTCHGCNKNLNLPDEKIPATGVISIKCPSCKTSIKVSREQEPLPAFGADPDLTATSAQILEETQDIQVPAPMSGDPAASFASMMEALEDEMDILEEGTSRALVADTENLELISPVVRKMEHLVTSVDNMDEALKKARFNFYDLVIINERFNGADPTNNAIHKFFEPLNMDVRRKMFIVLIGKNFKTMDNLAAFTKSVNLLLNESDFSNFELILKKSMKENDNFYHVFRKLLVDTGREVEF